MSELYQRFIATTVIDGHETQAMFQLSSPTIPKLSFTIWGTFTGSIINQKIPSSKSFFNDILE